MPFSRESLTDLKAQIATDIQSHLPGTDPLLRFSNLGITGKALANMINMCLGYLDWISLQSVPWTATDEFLYGWGALKGLTPKLGTFASDGLVLFSGVQGTVIPDQTSLTRSDGALFTVNGNHTIDSSKTVTVNATANIAGIDGNTPLGGIVALTQAIIGVLGTGAVSQAFTNGSDTESVDSFKARVLEIYQNPPKGGSQVDYVTWALAVPGVTRAWCNPLGAGAGTVVVYTMWDLSESAHGGFPQGSDGVATSEARDVAATGDQLAVANYVYPLRPVTSVVYSCAPVANTINFTIAGISSATTATKAAISAAITDVFLTFGSPVPKSQGNPNGLTVFLSYIEAAISSVSNTKGFLITSPSGNIVSSVGQLPVLGTITYS